MKRCILNVATGKYLNFQQRLINSLKAVNYSDSLITWTNQMPPNSPDHGSNPYAFKLFAIDYALAQGFTNILWCDSSVYFLKHPDSLFEKIKQDGHFFIIGGDQLGNWTSDMALELFQETRDSVLEKKFELLGGTIYGFDFNNPTTIEFFKLWKYYYSLGAFKGFYMNSCGDIPDNIRHIKKDKNYGVVSTDKRCRGHRHDETIASFIAYKLHMKLTYIGGDRMFQGNTEACVAKSGYI